MNMIEKVAAAIGEKYAPAVDQRAPYAKIMVRMAAVAAIEAMRELTPEMTDMHPPMANKQEFLASYRAMIDAALAQDRR